MEWFSSPMQTFGLGYREIMEMPFRTFMALNRVAAAKGVNKSIRKQFDEALGG